ncbi:MAG TPA: baseplate J/gp47 family protein [candidate division Zixibacteria bacterium]|nr:baseplate J/gp47 family protein [candidate division Zixibacteria bacterium]
MSNGKLIPPNLDDRKWQDIVDEAKALIPKYTPEWTDHNQSDLGITLIELFASIVEGMIYRLNKVPERNYIEFLNLLGITRDPATPASSFLTYRLASGITSITIPKGSQVATQQTEKEEGIVFETDKDSRILPINLTTALNVRYVGSFLKYQKVTTKLVSSPLTGLKLDIPPGQWTMIAIGFDSLSTETISLLFSFLKPVKKDDLWISWLYSSGSAWRLVPIMSISDETDKFQKKGTVSLDVPANWTSMNFNSWGGISPDSQADMIDQPLFWIGMVMWNLRIYTIQTNIEQILFNAAPATNALTIAQPELLGVSNGKPFQYFELRNHPLFKSPNTKDHYNHLIIQVRDQLIGGGFGPWDTWKCLDDIPEGSGNHYHLNPVTGTINFGNYSPTASPEGHGTIPKPGSEIRAQTYRYVAGGAKGNVPPSTINSIRTPHPSGVISVTNPGASRGGSNEEDIEETLRRGPEILRNRNRAVTIEDYEYLAREVSRDIVNVRALPPRLFEKDIPPLIKAGDPWMYANLNRSPGRINVIIIPSAPENVTRPKPDEELILEVLDDLNDRRVATSMLQVSGPKYLPIKVEVDLYVWQRAVDKGLIENGAQVQIEVTQKITKFLHPLFGNIDGNGWEIGQHIFTANLFKFIMPDPEIGFIERIQIKADIPDYHDPTLPWNPTERPFPINILGVWVQLADYELLCSGTHSVIIKGII